MVTLPMTEATFEQIIIIIYCNLLLSPGFVNICQPGPIHTFSFFQYFSGIFKHFNVSTCGKQFYASTNNDDHVEHVTECIHIHPNKKIRTWGNIILTALKLSMFFSYFTLWVIRDVILSPRGYTLPKMAGFLLPW